MTIQCVLVFVFVGVCVPVYPCACVCVPMDSRKCTSECVGVFANIKPSMNIFVEAFIAFFADWEDRCIDFELWKISCVYECARNRGIKKETVFCGSSKGFHSHFELGCSIERWFRKWLEIEENYIVHFEVTISNLVLGELFSAHHSWIQLWIFGFEENLVDCPKWWLWFGKEWILKE